MFSKKAFIMVFFLILSALLITGCGSTTPTTYTITATAGAGGSISPTGVVTVTEKEDQTFTITPDADYQIAYLIVDGISVGVETEYTFLDVTENRTIFVTFEAIPTTSEGYFTFDIPTKKITDYNIAGGSDVIIPSTISGVTVEHIGNSAFQYKALGSVIIPDSVTIIDSYAFYGNYLTSITIGNSVTHVGWGAFAENSLTSITIGNSVTSISYAAFAANQLTSVTIPDSVTSIDDSAFAENQLTSVTIGSNVDINDNSTTIGTNTGFKTVYDSGGQLAGTYNYSSGVWVKV